ncbi:MAG TPA: GspH/FimT family pseudopilin [Rubrivivax sp.]
MLESMMRRERARCARGFTVIELMTVVFVAAILLAVAVPAMREFAIRQRLKAVNAELVTDLQYARSESIPRNRPVRVHLRVDDPDMTCYTIHTAGVAIGRCDCRRPIGTACDDVAELEEIKTVQVLRSSNVTLVPPASPGNFVDFSGPQGLSNRNDFRITVVSSTGGALRTATNTLGRPQVCSPSGTIGGVPACAD